MECCSTRQGRQKSTYLHSLKPTDYYGQSELFRKLVIAIEGPLITAWPVQRTKSEGKKALRERFPLDHTPERSNNHITNLSQVSISLCVHVCLCIYRSVYKCINLCLQTWEGQRTLGLPWSLFILVLRQDLLLNLEPANSST